VFLIEAPVTGDGPSVLTARLSIFIVNKGNLPAVTRLGAPAFKVTGNGTALTSVPADRTWCANATGELVGSVAVPAISSVVVNCWWSRGVTDDEVSTAPVSITLDLTVDGLQRNFGSTLTMERTRRFADPDGRFVLSYPRAWNLKAGSTGDRIDLGTSAVELSPGECSLHLGRGEPAAAATGDPTEVQIGDRRYPGLQLSASNRRLIQTRADIFGATWLIRAECVDPGSLDNMRVIRTLVLPLWRPPAP
jgi:hypothetical protein